jgi:hypothetical protein
MTQPQVPLNGQFYNERANAVEQERINEQRRRLGHPEVTLRSDGGVANPRRVTLDGSTDPNISAAQNMTVHLPNKLVVYVGELISWAIAEQGGVDTGFIDAVIKAVTGKLSEVDVAQLRE